MKNFLVNENQFPAAETRNEILFSLLPLLSAGRAPAFASDWKYFAFNCQCVTVCAAELGHELAAERLCALRESLSHFWRALRVREREAAARRSTMPRIDRRSQITQSAARRSAKGIDCDSNAFNLRAARPCSRCAVHTQAAERDDGERREITLISLTFNLAAATEVKMFAERTSANGTPVDQQSAPAG